MLLFERKSRTVAADRDLTPSQARSQEKSEAGQTITPEIALTVSAVLAAFTILSEDISSLPLILYERQGRNKVRAYGSPYYRLLHDKPNPEHTSMIYRELVISHMLAWGNSYSQIVTNSAGDVTQLWPLRPDRMMVQRLNGEKIYLYRSTGGKKPRLFFADEILHVPAFGFDGLIGYGRISLARNAIGLSLAAEKYGSKFFVNDARPSVAIKHPGKLSDPAYKHLKDSWAEMHKGVDNSHNPAILEEGMDLETIGLPPEDAQFLETRRFQVSEIARIFRVPPHMIGDVTGSTSWGSGIESQEQGYINHTLRPWMVRLEQSLKSDLLLRDESDRSFFEHLLEGLLRGDLTARYGAYTQAITNGIMSANEVRERENLNPYAGGDEYYHPLNISSGSQGQTPGRASVDGLHPLMRATLARVLRREANDLRGAARRYLAREQQQSFQEWADAFYGGDHPGFVAAQLGPVLEAYQRLFGIDAQADVDEQLGIVFQERRTWLRSVSDVAVIEAVADEMTGQTAVDALFALIKSALGETNHD